MITLGQYVCWWFCHILSIKYLISRSIRLAELANWSIGRRLWSEMKCSRNEESPCKDTLSMQCAHEKRTVNCVAAPHNTSLNGNTALIIRLTIDLGRACMCNTIPHLQADAIVPLLWYQCFLLLFSIIYLFIAFVRMRYCRMYCGVAVRFVLYFQIAHLHFHTQIYIVYIYFRCALAIGLLSHALVPDHCPVR